MGTHPIFESDFGCLTDFGNMGAYKYMNEIWRKKQSETMRYLQRVRVWQYRNSTPSTVLQNPPVLRRPVASDTRPLRDSLFTESKSDVVDVRSPSLRELLWVNPFTRVFSCNLPDDFSLAEERVGRHCGALRVLTSYWVGEDSTY